VKVIRFRRVTCLMFSATNFTLFVCVVDNSATAGCRVRLEKFLKPLTPNDLYRGRTAPLTSKRCILYIYSTNIGTEYFKHGIYSPLFFLQSAVCFITLNPFSSCIIHI